MKIEQMFLYSFIGIVVVNVLVYHALWRKVHDVDFVLKVNGAQPVSGKLIID